MSHTAKMTRLEALKIEQKIARRLLHIEQVLALEELERSGEKDMAVSSAVAALITQFDDATNAIAARIQKLVDNSGLSTEDQAALQKEVDGLKALGQDPNNPVPVGEPLDPVDPS